MSKWCVSLNYRCDCNVGLQSIFISSNAFTIAVINSCVLVCEQEYLDSTPNLNLSGAGMSVHHPNINNEYTIELCNTLTIYSIAIQI